MTIVVCFLAGVYVGFLIAGLLAAASDAPTGSSGSSEISESPAESILPHFPEPRRAHRRIP